MKIPGALLVILAVEPSSCWVLPSRGQLDGPAVGASTVDILEEEKTLQKKAASFGAPPLPRPPSKNVDKSHWLIGPTALNPTSRPLTAELRHAVETGTHPDEPQDDLGRGMFVTDDWRRAWYTYASPSENPTLIDEETGEAEYCIDEIEGELPHNLVGVFYRNGSGKFGVDGDRVLHVLDAYGLIIQVNIAPPEESENQHRRKVTFRSKFVLTKELMEENKAKKVLYRSTFGTGPRGLESVFGEAPKNGLNEDPSPPPLLSRIVGNAMKTAIKNSANTQVISFGGKLLALFEAGLPYALDPETLDTLGEDEMGGTLSIGRLPMKIGGDIPQQFTPNFIGGAAPMAHPKMCPRTGHLIGCHWSQLVSTNSMELTFREWSPENFELLASSTFELEGCVLAPHDMALTENCVLVKVNALTLNRAKFLSGLKGAAESLEMDGRANVTAWVFPRPTSKKQFEPYCVEVPPCFSIHFSHAYEDEETGNIVTIFSGWPPSDATDFLGAWGGFAPLFSQIPVTYLWRLEIDPKTKSCVNLSIAPDAVNACSEFPVVHPNFSTSKAASVFSAVSNCIGDSSPPCGYARHRIEDTSRTRSLQPGEFNSEIDVFWFGSRCFVDEPLVVPKRGGDPKNEDEAFLLGMVKDAVRDKSYVAVFDLERDMRQGPVCRIWLKSHIPHGIHGCFAPDGPGRSSVFG